MKTILLHPRLWAVLFFSILYSNVGKGACMTQVRLYAAVQITAEEMPVAASQAVNGMDMEMDQTARVIRQEAHSITTECIKLWKKLLSDGAVWRFPWIWGFLLLAFLANRL